MIPYNRPWLDAHDRKAVDRVLRSSWLTTGPEIAALEQDLVAYTGAASVLAVSSGSSALALAFSGVNVTNSWVIVPSITFFSTASAVWRCGGNVWVADCDPQTGLMECHHLETAYQKAKERGIEPKAVVLVHLGGRMSDLDTIVPWCRRHGLKVVEDACHAFGGRYPNGEMVGKCVYSDFVCVSFHAVKTITCGEGGAIFLKDKSSSDSQYQRLATMRHHGISWQHRDNPGSTNAGGYDGRGSDLVYDIEEAGWNDRLSDIACSLGRSQLRKIETFVQGRRESTHRYKVQLARLTGWPAIAPGHEKLSSGHLYQIRIPNHRDAVRCFMHEAGIGAQCHYPALHNLTVIQARYGHITLSGADTFAQEALSIPLYYKLRTRDQQKVVSVLRQAYKRYG